MNVWQPLRIGLCCPHSEFNAYCVAFHLLSRTIEPSCLSSRQLLESSSTGSLDTYMMLCEISEANIQAKTTLYCPPVWSRYVSAETLLQRSYDYSEPTHELSHGKLIFEVCQGRFYYEPNPQQLCHGNILLLSVGN